MEKNFESDQEIADAYGIPFLFDQEYVMEDTEVAQKRLQSMNAAVTKWIEKNRKIPSGSPNAPEEERKMSLWLKVVMFYWEALLDPKDEHHDERISNEKIHKICQNLIRTGTITEETEL